MVVDVQDTMSHKRTDNQPQVALEADHGNAREDRGNGKLGQQDLVAAIDDGEQHVVRGSDHDDVWVEHAITVHSQHPGGATDEQRQGDANDELHDLTSSCSGSAR
jgi:hypothetical protein